MKKLAVQGILLALGACSYGSPSKPQGYHVVETLSVAGGVKWDYLAYDASAHRLFITHGDHVDILNTDNREIMGMIPSTDGVHGVALAQGLNRGFTSNGKANTVTIFALDSLKILGTVNVGTKPDAIAYDEASKRVFVANGKSGNISAIDAATGKNLHMIALNGTPEFIAVDGRGNLFVNLEDKNAMVKIDTKRMKVKARYDLSPTCDEPAGLAIDTDRQRLFASCHNEKLVVVDGHDGRILAAVPIGKGSDAAIYDKAAGLAFSSNSDGTLTVIERNVDDSYAVKQVVKTQPTARTMALDPASHRIYLAAAKIDHVDVPTKEVPEPRPKLVDGSFSIITVEP